MPEKITKYLNQVENSLVAVKPLKLIIDLDDYTLGDNLLIKEQEKQIYVSSLVSKVEFEDKMFNLILDYSANIWFGEYEKTNETIEVEYGADEVILEVTMEEQNIEEQVHYLERMLGGKEIYKDVTHLYNKLTAVYFPIADIDSVHAEVLLSNVLRDKSDPSQPARLGKEFNPTMMNIKDIVFKGSTMASLAFENINKATQTGLTSEKEPEPSIIEKLMTGQLE